MAKIFIDDGYTEDFVFDPSSHAGRAWNYPAFKIRVRPALPLRQRQYLSAAAPSADDYMRETCKFISEHLQEWDAEDQKGQKVPTQPQDLLESYLRRTPDVLLTWIVNCISGYGPVQARRDVKNSPSG